MNNKLMLLGIIILVSNFLSAQYNNDIIRSVQKLMIENYIFLDKAKQVNLNLDILINNGHFNRFKKPKEFAEALTKEMQKITNDKHLNIAPPRPRNNRHSRIPEFIPMHLQNIERFRQGGFGEINFFEGNVAYIHLKGFRVEDTIKVDPLMKYVSTADAIIIDLRGNISSALAILRAGSILFPNSPKAQDSYAEVLVRNNQNALALKYYKEAVFLAKKKDKKIELYQKNLDDFKVKM